MRTSQAFSLALTLAGFVACSSFAGSTPVDAGPPPPETPPEAGADGASVDAPPPPPPDAPVGLPDAPVGPGITCGPKTCDATTQRCCVGYGGESTICAAACLGDRDVVECDDTKDCPLKIPGSTCCLHTENEASGRLSTVCDGSCIGTKRIAICDPGSPCLNPAKTCLPYTGAGTSAFFVCQ